MMIRPCRESGANQLDDAAAQRDRGHEQAAVLTLAAVAGQVVEQVGEVLADLDVRRQQSDVLVQARGLRVVVAGAHVAVPAYAAVGATHHERRLRMGLEADTP